jgi:hypothetical protein
MEKSGNSRVRLKIVSEEVENFLKLIEGHRKLLFAIGEL